MTIIAGFKCDGGIVLCADTQETVGINDVNVSKRNVPKLRFEEVPRSQRALSGLPDLAVVTCGAGYGPFIDKLADEVWSVTSTASSLSDACDLAEQKIKDVYADFGQIYQAGRCPEVELIYGIKAEGGCRLFNATGPIVNEKDGYSAAGCGMYMADYLAGSMYATSLSVRQCVILAAYVLFQTKEHADGCGGDSHIAVLREKESSGKIDPQRIDAITGLLRVSQGQMGQVLLDSADLALTKEEFVNKANDNLEVINGFRENAAWRLKDWEDFWSTTFSSMELDDLGLFVPKKLKPSASQKSEPEP